MFFDHKRLFYSKHFDFPRKKSTIDILAEITKQIRQGSTFNFMCVLLDLHKAFDSINHLLLLAKLDKYGVRVVCSMWFQSNSKKKRRLDVQVNDVLLDFLYLLVGVRQSSILEPVLLLICIRDPPSACEVLKPTLSADDTIDSS